MGVVVPFHWRGVQESVVLFRDLYERALRGEVHSATVLIASNDGPVFLFSGADRLEPERVYIACRRMAAYLGDDTEAASSF